MNTQKNNLRMGGQSKVYVFFRGGCQKCMFVDKGEGGVKNVCTSFMDGPQYKNLPDGSANLQDG